MWALREFQFKALSVATKNRLVPHELAMRLFGQLIGLSKQLGTCVLLESDSAGKRQQGLEAGKENWRPGNGF